MDLYGRASSRTKEIHTRMSKAIDGNWVVRNDGLEVMGSGLSGSDAVVRSGPMLFSEITRQVGDKRFRLHVETRSVDRLVEVTSRGVAMLDAFVDGVEGLDRLEHEGGQGGK